MSSETVVITINGVDHKFEGDELTSPVNEAILFLKDLAKLEEFL